MISHKLTLKSLSSRLYRSIGLVLISLVLSFAVVFIAYTAVGMKHGSDNVKARMGADIIVVPDGYGDDLEGILLTTSKNYFYMDDTVVDEIRNVEGVGIASPQTFLMTMEASCCDQSVQIIGIDTKSDFTVSPWLEDGYLDSLSEGEIVVGSNVGVREGNIFQMFGEPYPVAGILDQSGSSMDYTVFIDVSQMETLMEYAQKAGQGVISEVNSHNVSAVLIKVEEDAEVSSVVGRLTRLQGVDIVTTETVSARLTSGLNDMGRLYLLIVVITVLIGMLIMFLIHYITLNERSKEVETLRILGVTTKSIKAFLLEEVLITSAAGAILGTLIGSLSFYVMFRLIEETSEIPFTSPDLLEMLLIPTAAFLLIALAGPLTSYTGIRKLCPEYVLE